MKSELTNGNAVSNKVALLLVEGARLPVRKRNTDVCNLEYVIYNFLVVFCMFESFLFS